MSTSTILNFAFPPRNRCVRTRDARGFTLIEVMITVVIVAILASIALPNYTEAVARGRRADAQTQLLSAAQFIERYFTANGTYVGVTVPTSLASSPASGTSQYMIAATGVALTTYVLTATPVAGAAMATDKCGEFIIDQTGAKTLGTTATAAIADCWRR